MLSMIPKREIGALEFIKNNPNYDGRGVIIAIWDTGVDPTARGLQVTSDGKPKILDLIDASGSGDVEMLSSFQITDSSRTITTPTGRTVTIPESWKPVDGRIRVGVKSASEVFPSDLLDQMRSEAVERYWRPTFQRLCDEMRAKVAAMVVPEEKSSAAEASNQPNEGTGVSNKEEKIAETVKEEGVDPSPALPSPRCGPVQGDDKTEEATEQTPPQAPETNAPASATAASPASQAEELEPLPNFGSFRECLDFLATLKNAAKMRSLERILATLNDNYEFFPPVFDCFVFKAEDGDFVACVDTSPYEETPTTLADLPLLKDFSIGRQVAHFGNDCLLYFTVKILDNGDLQIVTNSGSHGTHVAAIAAACFPSRGDWNSAQMLDEADQNGIAPGAQIVSIKIADTHLGGMETNTAFLTALNWTTKLNCDVINFSFGERAYLPNFGRIYTHLTQFVMETNVAFVTSGGNNGPALGTVGSPGGSVDALIGVAPLLYPKMMEYMYCQPTWKKSRNADDHDNNSCVGCGTKSTGDQKTATAEGTTTTDVSTVEESKPTTTTLPTAYTWGSRGPSPDGDLGLTVAACGAAVADVAAWKCSSFDLLNGSSMSSPSVAGGFALVLSALRQSEAQAQLRVPFLLWKAAIFACAKPLAHLSPLDQGAGVFKVGATFEYLRDAIRSKPPSRLPTQVNIEPVRTPSTTTTTTTTTGGSIDRFCGWQLSCFVTGPGCIVENSKGLHCRGIWLRRGWLPLRENPATGESPKLAFTVHLAPKFCPSVSAEFRRDFSLNLSVKVGYQQGSVESSSSSSTSSTSSLPDWLCVAPFVMMSSQSRSLPLFIDPMAFEASLPKEEAIEEAGVLLQPPSKVWHTCVAFHNADSLQKEVLAHLPITVQLPSTTQLDAKSGVHAFDLRGDFTATQKVCRWFVRIPRGSTAAVLRLCRTDNGGSVPCYFTISVVQPTPLGSALSSCHEVLHRRISLGVSGARGVGASPLSNAYGGQGDFVFAFPIHWVADCLEVTVAQHHGADAPLNAQITGRLEMHGLEVRPEKLVFNTADGYVPLALRSHFGLESIKFDLESKCWIEPVRPASSSRFYRKLPAYEEGSLGMPGLHGITLTYKIFCPFKADNVVFDLRRLTSLLYEADVVQAIYHLYDDCGRFKGAGSYQSTRKPKYRFKMTKGLYQLITTILYADTKKVSYASKDSDALDKLAHYPLLIRWPLPSSSEDGVSNQLTLEVSTSLATLALSDVDYKKSVALLVRAGASGAEAYDETEEVTAKSPKKDPLFGGGLQKFPTVPSELGAGECVSEVVGIIEESLAPCIKPGSYIEGQMSYYDNAPIKTAVKLPLEIHVGPRDISANAAVTLKVNQMHGVMGLRAKDLWQLRWIYRAHFEMDDDTVDWVSPFEAKGGILECGGRCGDVALKSNKRVKKKSATVGNGGTNASCAVLPTSVPKPVTQALNKLLAAGLDNTANPDRAAVYKAVAEAMAHMASEIAAVVALDPKDPAGLLLLDRASSATTVVMAPSASEAEAEQETQGEEESMQNQSLVTEAATTVDSPVSPPKAASPGATTATERLLTRAQAIEALSVYGRYLCEHLVLTKTRHLANSPERIALEQVSCALQRLLCKAPPVHGAKALRNYFDSNLDDTKLAATLGFCPAELERVRPVFGVFWLAQLFVLQPQVPLLEALTRLAFQLDTASGKTAATLGSKRSDSVHERAMFECAAIAFPLMVQQLKRMGLGALARRLERQMPSRFASFDYTLVLSRPPTLQQQQQQQQTAKPN